MCAPPVVPLRRRFLHLQQWDAACMSQQQQQHPAKPASVLRQSNGDIHARLVRPPPFDQRPSVDACAHPSTYDTEFMCSFSRIRLAYWPTDLQSDWPRGDIKLLTESYGSKSKAVNVRDRYGGWRLGFVLDGSQKKKAQRDRPRRRPPRPPHRPPLEGIKLSHRPISPTLDGLQQLTPDDLRQLPSGFLAVTDGEQDTEVPSVSPVGRVNRPSPTIDKRRKINTSWCQRFTQRLHWKDSR